MMDKKNLRKVMKDKLSLLSEVEFNHMSLRLSKNLKSLLSVLGIIQDIHASDKMVIGTFAPIEKEPLWYLDLMEMIDHQTAFPAILETIAENKGMTFKMARMVDLVVQKDFGVEISGPKDTAQIVSPNVILVPGLAMNKYGERLGRGRGFYDRFLKDCNAIKIGICFSLQLLSEELPTEEHDEKLDFIVTEEKIINCKIA